VVQPGLRRTGLRQDAGVRIEIEAFDQLPESDQNEARSRFSHA